MFPRSDPGPCLVCGAPHSACTHGPATTVAIPQLPNRDAAIAAASVPPLVADTVQATLPPGHFTTGTYRGDKGKGKRA